MSKVSAFKLNLMLGLLKLVTATSPFNFVLSRFKSKLLATCCFLTSACTLSAKSPLTAPLGKVGSLTSKLPANLGRSKIISSILPLKGEENLPSTVRAPCFILMVPLTPLLCTALSEPLISASTILACMLSLPFLLVISAFTPPL